MENIFEKIKQSGPLPKLPQVMVQLIRACGSDNTNADELTRIISADAGLTSRLISIMSSAYLNLASKQVNTIKSAVMYLGLDTIRNIAISSSAMQFFSMSQKAPGFDLNRFWYQSYKCAVLAQQIAIEENQINPDEFFLAGLLHDIGSLVLMNTFPREYESVLKKKAQGKNLYGAQTTVFNIDSPRVSAWLFNQWHLNPVTSDSVQFLNQPLERIQEELPHVKILYMAKSMAQAENSAPMEMVLTLTDLPEFRLEKIVAQAEEEVQQMAGSLSLDLNGGGKTDTGLAMDPNQDPNQDQAQQALLAGGLKDISLFFGTLDSLLKARDIDAIMDAVHRGLEIIFNTPRVFFFFMDREKDLLTGTCAKEDRHYNIVRSIALAMDSRTSLVVKSVYTCTVQSGGGSDPMAVPDTQILRFLETPALYVIPIAGRDRSLGAIVLGVDQTQVRTLDKNKGLVDLFSRQTGICLENVDFHQAYARDMNDKKMEAYAALTDKVVHEINNPIAIIRNYLETLKLKLPDKHPAQEELAVVGEEMVRVSSLLEGLTSFSKPKIGGLETIDLNQICRRVLEVLKKSILLPRQIQVKMELDEGITSATLDSNGLKQVIINLIKNAAEAMEKGGEIRFSTQLLPGSVKVLIDEKKKIPGFVQITIKDDGPGIPAKIRERLFEPYNSSKKSGTNSGLGLAIVHSIVKEMQGRITCDSRQGEGTSFTVLLPLTPDSCRTRPQR